ncbi:MAG TPA: hypothetical protein VEU07_14200 [Candidatus Acidoferrum sp.]|nr:hypothetical protein [Candidatus Acidoferrum sp.]
MNRLTATLESHPLCRKLVVFLLKNKGAMDNATGVAFSWLQCDKAAAQDALDRMASFGVITTRTLTRGTLYGFTQSPEIRAWLKATVKGQDGNTRVSARPLNGEVADALEDQDEEQRLWAGDEQPAVHIDTALPAQRDRRGRGRR